MRRRAVLVGAVLSLSIAAAHAQQPPPGPPAPPPVAPPSAPPSAQPPGAKPPSAPPPPPATSAQPPASAPPGPAAPPPVAPRPPPVAQPYPPPAQPYSQPGQPARPAAPPPARPGAPPRSPAAPGQPEWRQGTGPIQPSYGQQKLFCQPGLEIRCSCGPNHWETTRCREDGSNWEFCPCPEGDKPPEVVFDRPSKRSSAVIGTGIALTAIGAIAFGVSATLKAAEVAECQDPDEPCPQAWIGLLGGGIVFTSVGIPLWVHGTARNHQDVRPRSTAMMVGGSLLAGVGLVAIAAGNTNLALGEPVGWAPVILGTVAMSGGIALEVYGGWEVPDVPEPKEQEDLFSRRMVPEISVGLGSASARWTF